MLMVVDLLPNDLFQEFSKISEFQMFAQRGLDNYQQYLSFEIRLKESVSVDGNEQSPLSHHSLRT